MKTVILNDRFFQKEFKPLNSISNLKGGIMKTTAKCVLYLAIVMFVLSLSTVLFAKDLKDLRGVQLLDGTVIHGKVIESNINQVVIEKKDGNRVSVKFDNVSNFIYEGQPGEKTTSIVPMARQTWEIAPELSYIEYREPHVMSEKGPMFGIGVAYSYHDGVMIKVAGRFSYGLVDYENSGHLNNIEDRIFEFRALGGYDFKVSSSFTVTPFIGFGYRYLKDNMGGDITSTGAYGYDRESNYYYSPIGIEAVYAFDKGWSAGVILEYDYFWKGTQKSCESDIDAGYNDIKNDQDGGYGLRGSIIIKKQSDRVFYAIEPFIRYWHIDKSDVKNETYYGYDTGYVVWEPKNNSTEIGLKFMIGF